MTRYQSPDDVLKEYKNILGNNFGGILKKLENEYFWLVIKWKEYKELYGTSENRITLLNNAAPQLFKIFQDSLWYDILLSLTRLTDPKKSLNKKNLSFSTIPPLITNLKLQKHIIKLIKDAKDSVRFARDWRNRLISHLDLKLAVNDIAEPLLPANRKNVDTSLNKMHKIFNTIHIEYFNSELFNDVITYNNDAISLLYVIRDGLKLAQQKEDIQPVEPI